MKITYRLAHPKDAYCFVEGVEDLPVDELKPECIPLAIRDHYALLKAAFEEQTNDGFQKVETFTGETILYNPEKHEYRTLDGKPLLSGSAYKKSLEKPFNVDEMAPRVAKKHDVKEEHIRDMWQRNGEISAGLGTSLHQAMEQWFKHRGNGTEKNYHLPKHPFLRKAVESFPLKDAPYAFPEIMVSDVANGRVGQIDLFVPASHDGPPAGKIIDFKSDAECAKNAPQHFNQLSFYAHILMAKGWEIEGLEVWNYTSSWTKFESPVLPLKI